MCSQFTLFIFKGTAVGKTSYLTLPLLLHSVVLAVPDLHKSPVWQPASGAFALVAGLEP